MKPSLPPSLPPTSCVSCRYGAKVRNSAALRGLLSLVSSSADLDISLQVLHSHPHLPSLQGPLQSMFNAPLHLPFPPSSASHLLHASCRPPSLPAPDPPTSLLGLQSVQVLSDLLSLHPLNLVHLEPLHAHLLAPITDALRPFYPPVRAHSNPRCLLIMSVPSVINTESQSLRGGMIHAHSASFYSLPNASLPLV